MRTRTPLALTTALLAAAVGLAGCGSDGPDPSEAASPVAPPAATTTSAAPETTSASPEPTSAAPSTTSAAPVSFPPAVSDPVQGGTYFAVFLEVSRTTMSNAETEAAEAAAAKVGYTVADGEVGTGELDCTQGARAALNIPATGDYFATSIYFRTAAQAKQFVDAYEPGVVGTAQVKAFCLD